MNAYIHTYMRKYDIGMCAYAYIRDMYINVTFVCVCMHFFHLFIYLFLFMGVLLIA